MADQCIVCLDNLDVQSADEPHTRTPSQSPSAKVGDGADNVSSPKLKAPANLSLPASKLPSPAAPDDDDGKIALIDTCRHFLHDGCLRAWTDKANSCPICRQAFHLVHVYDKVGGTQLSSYKVEDKKQVAEFDPQTWLDENPEEEEAGRPCPICDRADNEDVLLLCDSCDAPYHTYCVDLDSVPRGHWFCMECAHQAADLLIDEFSDSGDATGGDVQRSDYLPRTQATMRRARRRARSDEWQGAWGQIAGRVWDALDLDLDNNDDDEALRNYRRSQQRQENERREYQRWQQRLNIASRLGARDVFVNNISNVLPQRVTRQRRIVPPSPQQTPEEMQAWGALDKAMEASSPARPTPAQRKRKSRSISASPVEAPQPERKLKRPRTRRVPTQGEASSSKSPITQSQPAVQNGASSSSAPLGGNPIASPPQQQQNGEVPSFLSTLLKEVEMSAPNEDETIRALFAPNRSAADPSSPVASPSPSAHSSPRALSTTPPPRGINDRPGSPLSLTSRIEPVYPPANYSPNRNGSGSDSESDSRPRQARPRVQSVVARSPEIHQPRPQRQQQIRINTAVASIPPPGPALPPRPHDNSPTGTRTMLPIETKESISGIIKNVLKPHWKSGHINADQYTVINRDLSRKLYDEVTETALNDDDRHRCEKIAVQEVARAVAELKET